MGCFSIFVHRQPAASDSSVGGRCWPISFSQRSLEIPVFGGNQTTQIVRKCIYIYIWRLFDDVFLLKDGRPLAKWNEYVREKGPWIKRKPYHFPTFIFFEDMLVFRGLFCSRLNPSCWMKNPFEKTYACRTGNSSHKRWTKINWNHRPGPR